MNEYHTSVLLHEAREVLRVRTGKKYIDATLGGGGHSLEIIKHGGIVLGIDVDAEALEFVRKNFKFPNLTVTPGNFKDIDQIAKENEFIKVAGILFDLGVSGHQIDQEERGFSFQKDAPLDMRMDKKLSVSAKDLINALTKGELYELFTKLGEDHFAKVISDNIVSARGIKPITTTGELAKIVIRSYPKGYTKIHPATKVFQALRIAVNDELHNLQQALPKAVDLLEHEGRLVVISFHSLEDRIVKNYFKDFERKNLGKNLTEKPDIPSKEEMERNKKSRSAKMRVFEKL